MTAMVDLAFLLLTFFMLTTTLMEPTVIAINMPKEDEGGHPPPVPSKRVLTLVLAERNKLYWYTGLTDPELYETDYSSNGISAVLITKKREVSKLIVLVKPSDSACYQNMVDVIDEMEILDIPYYLVKITETDKTLVKEFKAKSLMTSSP